MYLLQSRGARRCFVFILLLTSSALFAADNISTQLPRIEETASSQPAAPREPEKKTPPPNFAAGPAPMWIWGATDGEACQLEKTFPGGATTAHLLATCDNRMVVYLNDKRAAESDVWETPIKNDVSKLLLPGNNRIRVEAKNGGGPKGFVLKLVLTMPDGSQRYVVSDESWRATTDKNAADQNEQAAAAVNVLGEMGTGPWGNIFQKTSAIVDFSDQSQRGVFNVLPGFQVELLYSVPKGSQGSWVSITFDDKGRLIASDQGDQGLYRITPAAIGSDEETKVEKINVKMTGCQGMLYTFGKLYCSVNGGIGSGLYTIEDTDGDDQFDKVTKLKPLRGGGEHGPHAVRLSPDGKSLYVIAGNHTDPPEAFDHSRLPRNWGEDHLLPRQWDANGHARGKLAPGGWVAKTDPEGKTWEIFSSGYRNPYDMDFNADGELFVYDADMEWDMGMPWYRPTRVSHSPSGSEFGWRSGTGKWPAYYVDSLPATVDIGPGSPVGATFGYGAKFPAKYQNALYILDWTFATIYAIHLEADGASYKGVK
ncbi:MAG TPA: cytochrome C, partial [Pirellulales bacterium]|nr:cytochrome C [Pirellulales bacterium]